jgi:hypothetical protein
MPKRTEKQEIKRDGAKGVKNSGRGMRKGDAELNEFLVDYKHNASTFTITRKAWRKMQKDSWNAEHKYPCISVVLGEDSDTKVAIIDWAVFMELIPGSHYE